MKDSLHVRWPNPKRVISPHKARSRAIATVLAEPIKAGIVVHLYGQPAAMPEIAAICARQNLFVIEDCAQAHGASLDPGTKDDEVALTIEMFCCVAL
jgi:DegT/DnrJ/EryC1/StrS aminotransferase family